MASNNAKTKKSVKVQIKKKVKNKEKELTFTKCIVIFILCVAELQVCASYILAFLGKESIAETLSSQIVVTVVGTIIGYFIKSLIENIFKNNDVYKKKTIDDPMISTEVIEKIEPVEKENKTETINDSEFYG